ncbi:hypothetical protein [Gilvimarinus sp. 1_MG-2023]|uniref:hypothetical protein n=1 Tax=Gilvimarinus sp. 1_MG-2023 TaxID=3062638 RepID=UPI0026E16495|nr:hypothetical protein [Gilvimarinus sp. 1_MG-2023]MDO6746932.1 hypothetical protein [Gilvimarinus sp. 1_MG-2023]
MLKLLPIKRRKTVNKQALLILALALTTGSANAVELDQLHLPKSYLRYLPQLLDGARLMESSEQCHKFLSGTLKADASRLERPVFVYACRDESLLTYRWLVDGIDLTILDSTRPTGRISFTDLQAEIDAERERMRALEAVRQEQMAALKAERVKIESMRQQEQKRRQELLRRKKLWQVCMQKFKFQTQNMQAVELKTLAQPQAIELTQEDKQAQSQSSLSDGSPAAAASNLAIRFIIDFDARDIYDQALNYRGYCDVSAQEEIDLNIHPRALELESAQSSESVAR